MTVYGFVHRRFVCSQADSPNYSVLSIRNFIPVRSVYLYIHNVYRFRESKTNGHPLLPFIYFLIYLVRWNSIHVFFAIMDFVSKIPVSVSQSWKLRKLLYPFSFYFALEKVKTHLKFMENITGISQHFCWLKCRKKVSSRMQSQIRFKKKIIYYMNCWSDIYIYIGLIVVVNVNDQAMQSWLVESIGEESSANGG